MWTAKLAGRPMPGRSAAAQRGAVSARELFPKKAFAGLVLGIDPSLRGTGLALIEFQPGRMPLLLRCRTVRIPASRTMASAIPCRFPASFARAKTHEAAISIMRLMLSAPRP